MEFHLQMVNLLAKFLDDQFRFAGKRFGVSAIVDLIPGIGDVLLLVLAGYIIWVAGEMGVPQAVRTRMVFHVILSFLIGLIPVIGDVAYIFYRPNHRNMKLLQKYTTSVAKK
jgi:hypothetical protein